MKTQDEFREYLKQRIAELIDQAMRESNPLDHATCQLTIAAYFMKTGFGFVVRGDIAREQLAQLHETIAVELRKSFG